MKEFEHTANLIKKHFLFSKGNIVFIHGLNSTWYDSNNFINNLYNDGYNVYAFDLPNHGNNNEHNTQLDISEYCNYAKSWIERNIKNKSFILVGHSMGGAISSIIAYQFEKLRKLILIAPYQEGATKNPLTFIMKNITNVPEYISMLKPNNPTCKPISLVLNLLSPKVNNEIKASLNKFKNKAYLIIGREDKVINPKYTIDFLTSNLKSFEYSIIDEATHSPMESKFDDFYSNFIKYAKK